MNAFAALAPLRDKLLDGQEDLAADLIEKVGWFRCEAIATPDTAAEASAWLRTRIDAISAVIDDERRRARADRDQDWVDDADAVRRQAIEHWCRVREIRAKLERAA